MTGVTAVGCLCLVTLAAEPPKVDLEKQPTLYVVGYAHLDTQWRWTYVDTIKSFIPNTLHHNFALFEKHPDYIFNFSGSRRYRMMQEYYPEDYARLKKEVTAGRWFPCGSSVDENDANVPSAESMIRHVLYGNKYFRHEFGTASDEFMLPDCFGFPAALPSVLAHCGLKGFSTQKLTWNACVPIPFKVGVWEGPDGRGVIAALDPGAYVGEVKEDLSASDTWKTRIDANGRKSGTFVDYHYYGTGDQGGAPDEKSVAMVEQSVHGKGPIKVVSSHADWMFDAISPEERGKLPVYRGELELTEHSAGSISSEAYMKRWNRKNELLADAAERAAVTSWWFGAREYPSTRIEDAWYLLLGSQMHDILPGTSVPRAYDFSWNDEVLAANQFGQVLTESAGAVISRMDTSGAGTSVVVFNPLSFEREDVVVAEIPTAAPVKGAKVTGPARSAVPAQILSVTDGVARVAIQAKVPSVGFAVFNVELTPDSLAMSSTLRGSEHELENDFYRVKLDDNGDVASIYDKKEKRELLAKPARLALHYENPRQWPAWNQDWEDRQKPPTSFVGGPARFRVVEQGPVRAAIEVTRSAEGSTFVQQIRLASGAAGARIEFDTHIDWRTRERSLRAWFPLLASNPTATYDIQTGVIERGNGHAKQFEYPFHEWFDLTDSGGGFGVSIISDSKYASDKPDDSTIRLTLLHTPGTRGGYPDQGSQDLGRHDVLYALYGHGKDWRVGGTPLQAACVNQPLVAFRSTPHAGELGRTFSLLKVSDANVMVTAVKKAEESDEVVVRLRELTGSPAKGVKVIGCKPIASAREVDGQERPLGKATVTGGELVTDIHGYGLRAFALKLSDPPSKMTPPSSTPVTIPYDIAVTSTNSQRGSGRFDSRGRSIPAEQLPPALTIDGIRFQLGPTTDGAHNALICRGQEFNLPPGDFDRLSLIAAADDDMKSNLTIAGKSVPWNVQAWGGMIGQWDRRLWPADGASPGGTMLGDIIGLVPGFVKSDPVAWYCSHQHSAQGDAFYEYSYLYKYDFDLPPGSRSVRLPGEPRIKILAATVSNAGPDRVVPASPLFDTLADHVQDAPRIVAPAKPASDLTSVTIEPNLYWRDGGIRYTIDGSAPVYGSPVYHGPIDIPATTTIKAAVVAPSGKMGPVSEARVEVMDTTPPSVTSVTSLYGSPAIAVVFSEPVEKSSVNERGFAINPPIPIRGVSLSDDRRRATITLDHAPDSGHPYQLAVSGVRDSSPGANEMKQTVMPFEAAAPVFMLTEIPADQRGKEIRDVKGLPIKSGDSWTINMFVKMEKQPPNRTLIAGFGKSAQTTDGNARYLSKFGNGIHFWSHNRDAETSTQLELGRWQMLTATYDGTTLRLYRDAEKIAERSVALSDDENVINIAPVDPWEHRRRFEGDIRDFSIWDAALTEESIRALASQGSRK